MTTVDEAEVRRLARLARLELTRGEVERLASELGGVLGHFAALRELDETSAEMEAEAAGGVRLRPDVPAPDPLTRPPAELAPDWRAEHFVVPRLSAMRSEEGEP